MDPNFNASNAERADDLTDSRPGGVQPDHETVALEGRSPPSPTPRVQVIEDTAPPPDLLQLIAGEAEQEDGIPLPDGRGIDIEAFFHQLLANSDSLPDGPMVFELDGDDIRINPMAADDPDAERVMAMVRQVETMPAESGPGPMASEPCPPRWEDVLRPLAPEPQALLQAFHDHVHQIMGEYRENPDYPGLDMTVIDSLLHDLVEARAAADALPPPSGPRINRLLDYTEREVSEMMIMVSSRREVVRTLDSLASTDFALLNLERQPQCSICFENYTENDSVVLLPCHPSHHFHRSCMNVSLYLVDSHLSPHSSLISSHISL